MFVEDMDKQQLIHGLFLANTNISFRWHLFMTVHSNKKYKTAMFHFNTSVILASGVPYTDSKFPYITLFSSWQEHSLRGVCFRGAQYKNMEFLYSL